MLFKFCTAFVKYKDFFLIIIILLFDHTKRYVGILVPQPGIEPAPPALEAWTTREVPQWHIFKWAFFFCFQQLTVVFGHCWHIISFQLLLAACESWCEFMSRSDLGPAAWAQGAWICYGGSGAKCSHPAAPAHPCHDITESYVLQSIQLSAPYQGHVYLG